METIWDILLTEDMGGEAPEWHEEVLQERKKKINSDNAEFVSIAELKNRQ